MRFLLKNHPIIGSDFFKFHSSFVYSVKNSKLLTKIKLNVFFFYAMKVLPSPKNHFFNSVQSVLYSLINSKKTFKSFSKKLLETFYVSYNKTWSRKLYPLKIWIKKFKTLVFLWTFRCFFFNIGLLNKLI